MMKREALERCIAQWQQIQIELYKMEAAAIDDELDAVPVFSMLKRKVLRNAGVSEDNRPMNSCYLCEYVETEHPAPATESLACEYCPLNGYAWEQCAMDGPYFTCVDAYDEGWFGDAADCAQKIIAACDAALEDLDDEE